MRYLNVWEEKGQCGAAMDALRPVARRLRMLGVVTSEDLNAFLKLVKVTHGVVCGETLVSSNHSGKHFVMLLDGLACTSIRHEDGGRQICTFHYPGDFVGLHRYIFSHSNDLVEVEALTCCSIGTIDHKNLDQILQRHPALGLALWRAALAEANSSRVQLATLRRPALQRVAHLLCEQLARRVTLGIDNGVIPLSQMVVADAAGLSVVHTNRIFQKLRRLGVLSKKRLAVEVLNKERLQELAVFDGRYLNTDESMLQWDVRMEV